MLDIIARVCQKRAGKLCKFRKLKRGHVAPFLTNPTYDLNASAILRTASARASLLAIPDLRPAILASRTEISAKLASTLVSDQRRPSARSLATVAASDATAFSKPRTPTTTPSTAF